MDAKICKKSSMFFVDFPLPCLSTGGNSELTQYEQKISSIASVAMIEARKSLQTHGELIDTDLSLAGAACPTEHL